MPELLPFDTELVGTFLAGLPAVVAAALLVGARRFTVKSGSLIFVMTDQDPRVGVLLEGIARAYLRAADGRQLTVRYARRGRIIGKLAAASGDGAALALQAVSECTVLELDPDRFVSLIGSEVSVATAMVRELIARLEDTYTTIGDAVFGSMRQRVVRHLLALATNGPAPNRATAAITQQQLADGIGATREAVARLLAVLRNEGLIRTSPREIELLDVRSLSSFLGEWRRTANRRELDLTFEAQELLEASPNPVVAVDADGAIVFANTAAESVFGWPRPGLIGMPVEVLVPERLRQVHADHRYGFFERPYARPMGLGLSLWGRRHDGTEFPITASLTTIDTRGGVLVIATVVDLSPAAERDAVLAV